MTLTLMGAGPEAGGPPAITRYRDAVLTDSPAAYWRLAETSGTVAADSAGTFTGTYVNAPTLGVASAISDTGDKAITLAAASSQSVNASLVSTATDNFAIECWAQNTSGLSQFGVFAFNGDDVAGGGGWGLGISNGTGSGVGFSLTYFLGGITAAAAGYTFADTNWHHFVMTREAGTLKFYADGASTGTTVATAPGATGASAAARIGCQRRSAGGDYRFFSGEVDEVAIYNTALTAARVSAHYAAR